MGSYALRGGVDQRVHTDYEHKRVAHLLQHTHLVPLTCLWALEYAFDLRVQLSDANGSSVTYLVQVPAGHMIVFRANLFHGGARALSSHFRVHAYVVPDGIKGLVVDAVFT